MKHSTDQTLILSSKDIQEIIQHYGIDTIMDKLIHRITDVISCYNTDNTIIPIRSGFNYEKPYKGLIEWMPLFDVDRQVTIKVVGYHPSNPTINNLPTILSTISAYDTHSGHLSGIVDGVLLTALRTGAASAIASKYLAHPESRVLGLIGCGAQAVTQLHALSRVFDFQTILIYDVDIDTMLSFKERCSALNINVQIMNSNIEEIVRTSDILCTATSIDVEEGPLFNKVSTQPHLHINAVGADFPGKVELPLGLLKQSFVCPDFIEQALIEGECQQLEKSEINADLAKVVKNPNAFLSVQHQQSVFDSTGWALEDRAVMELFMEYAYELGVGQLVAIEYIAEDAKNPYHFLYKNAATKVSA